MTYGAETLTLTKRTAGKMREAQRAMESAMLGITRRDKIPDEIIRRTKLKDIIKIITQKKWKWAGYIARMTNNRWIKRILEWRPRSDKRSRGRSPTRWNDDAKRIVGNRINTAKDRDRWFQLEEAYIQQWIRMAGG